MRVELRLFNKGQCKQVLLIAETTLESRILDVALGSKNFPIKISGEVTLADGYGEHYIRIEKGAKNELSLPKKRRNQ